MNGGELLFIVLVVAFFLLWLYKLANVFSVGQLYNNLISWITFIGNLLIYGMVFLLTLALGGEFLYTSVLFSFLRYFLMIYFIFHIIEVFFALRSTAVDAAASREKPINGFRNG